LLEVSIRRVEKSSGLSILQGHPMRRLVHCLGCILPLSISAGGVAAAAEQDPPHRHYAVSHIPPDPALEKAPKIGHYRGWLRPQVDLTRLMPPVGDQGQLGSGIAWAVAYAARSYYAGRNENRDIESPDNEASPAYVFHAARKGDCAKGATLTDAVEVLRKGALSLADYPYKPDCQEPPAAAEMAAARDFKVKGYRVLDNSRIDDVKTQLFRSNPVVTLFRTSAAFQDFRGADIFHEDEKNAAPSAGEDNYQPLVLIGYDDQKQAVRAMNSWGRGWGDQGFVWISYEDFAARSKGSIVLDVAAGANQEARLRDDPTVPPLQSPDLKREEIQGETTTTLNEPPKDDVPPDPKPPIVQPDPVEPLPPPPPPSPSPPKVKLAMADLRRLPCSKIDQVRGNGRVTLDGFVSSDEDYAKVQEIATNEPNVSVGHVTVAPWPLCEALDTLDKPLKAPIRPDLTTSANGVVRAGDMLRVDLKSPSKSTYVYLSYFSADQTVTTLVQPQGIIPQQTPPRSRLVYGDGGKDHGTFIVGPPFGNEMIVAITSASPLFDGQLGERLSERDYLSALRKALIYKPVARLPDREVGAAIQVLKTQPN
jgi:Papain family cysteine protease/Domain of unknown function (DUF4384)